MDAYAYHRPKTLDETFTLLARTPDARLVAGGTDLMVRIREGTVRPPALVSLRRVAELAGIDMGPPIRIGALTTVGDLLRHEPLQQVTPALCDGARRIGGAQIRNAATVGGNLCNGSPCADLAPPLLVYGAGVEIAHRDGVRQCDLEEVFVAPGETTVGPGEVLTAVTLSPPASGARAVFLKHGRVRMDIAVTSVAVLVERQDGGCARVRVAAGSVGPRPTRLHEVEAELAGRELTDEVIARARAAAEGEVQPITDVRATADYRRHLSGALVARALRGLRDGDTQ